MEGNRMAIVYFQDLRVYKTAFENAMKIYDLSKQWPKEEQYALTDQIRRSSRSICSNIAEAWSERRYIAHFVSKLSDADGEASETQVWLAFAHRCGYLTESNYPSLTQRYKAISGGLVKMMSEPDKWCGPANLVKEDLPVYEDLSDL